MTTWTQAPMDGPDYSGSVDICTNHFEALQVKGDARGAGTISSPLVLTLSLEGARQLFGSLGNTIALIEANSDSGV